MQISSVAPPKDIPRMDIGLTMADIPAAQGDIPTAMTHFLSGDIAPALIDIAFIAHLINHNRFMKLVSPGLRPLGLRRLDTAVRRPVMTEVIDLRSVMNRPQML